MLDTAHGFAGIVSSILRMFDVLVPVLVALALVMFLIGGVRYIYSEGEHEKRSLMLWSLVALFVLVSVWGILRLLSATFIQGQGVNAQCDPATGQCYGPY